MTQRGIAGTKFQTVKPLNTLNTRKETENETAKLSAQDRHEFVSQNGETAPRNVVTKYAKGKNTITAATSTDEQGF